jgi:glycosyltransferase involved in cell wall biosynthesis
LKTTHRSPQHKTDAIPRVLMSTLGRSHFIVAADALVSRGVCLDIIQGWVPQDLDSWIVRLCEKIIGRSSFVAGLAKRSTPALRGHIITAPLAECLSTAGQMTLGRINQRMRNYCVRFSFIVHGWMTKRHLRNYDIFHVKSGLGQGGAIKRAHQLGIKVLVDHCTPHPYFMGENCQRPEYRERWSFWTTVLKDCAEADLLMVGSELIKNTFVHEGYPVDKIRVVPLGILGHFQGAKTEYAKSGTLQLIYTGAWKYEKGASFLVDAMAILKLKGVDCHLSVFGSYTSSDDFVLKGKGLPITLYGHVPQEELRQHLAKADLYVFPSLSDGFAVSAHEAMAAGLCIITTRESSLQIEEGHTGFIVPARSASALANQIAWLNVRRELLETVGQNAAAMVREYYTWSRYAKDVALIYQELSPLRGGAARKPWQL